MGIDKKTGLGERRFLLVNGTASKMKRRRTTSVSRRMRKRKLAIRRLKLMRMRWSRRTLKCQSPWSGPQARKDPGQVVDPILSC